MIIAVDGPAAAGKGTIARALASHLGFHHLDTGSLYRRVGLALDQKNLELNAPDAERIARSIDSYPYRHEQLRTESIARAASIVAAMPGVRAALMQFQRDFALKPPGVVMDGRDIGTVVCPDADIKFFVTASPQVRAERRHEELKASNPDISLTAILNDIQLRDDRDRSRPISPLLPAPDAVILDTSGLTIDEAVASALDYVTRRMASSQSGTSKG
jgi:CMP/dCMP kinase